MEKPIIHLESVSKSYRKKEAINNLTLSIPPGVSYGLIGRNGAGKTTALRLIMGMLHPTKGTVRVFDGDPVTEAERVKLHIGYLAEDQIFPSVLYPVDLFRFFEDCYPTWDHTFAQSLINRFKIPTQRRLSTLSKGEQRQVGLLCAVAHRPKLLILDEPGGGLDPVVRRGFLEEVIELLANEETTVLFSSHHLQEVERIATRIGILHEGQLLLEEDLDRLREGSCEILAELNGTDPLKIKKSLPNCVRAVRHQNNWLLTMLCNEAQAREHINRLDGGRVQEVRSLNLEDLFIRLVGGEK